MRNIKLDAFDLVESPKIRDDSFFGGRCEPLKLIYDFRSKGEKGKYVNVVSLYPTVMYYDRYPIGHPKRISKPEEYNTNWFGLVYKQKIKQAAKLLFGLCKNAHGSY